MIDWDLAIKPLLSGNAGSISAPDGAQVIKAIVSNKDKILAADALHESFYSLFVTLAGQALPGCFTTLDKTELANAAMACRVIIQYCVTRIVNYDSQQLQTAVSQNHLVLVVMSLCGEHVFRRPDVIAFVALIKSAKLPMLVRKESEEEAALSPRQDQSEESASTTNLFTIFQDCVSESDPGKDISKSLEQMNVRALQELAAEHKLQDALLDLPYIKRYIGRHQACVKALRKSEWKPLAIPTTLNDANSMANEMSHLQKNVRLMQDALNPPILGPLNQEQLSTYCDAVLGCLSAGINAAAAVSLLQRGNKAQQFDESMKSTLESATNIVKDASDLFHSAVSCLAKSTHFGLNVCRNFQFLALCHLLHGLDVLWPHVKEQTTCSLLFMSLAKLAHGILKETLEGCNSGSGPVLAASAPVDWRTLGDVNSCPSPLRQFEFLKTRFPVLKTLVKCAATFFNEVHQSDPATPKTPRAIQFESNREDELTDEAEDDEESNPEDDQGPLVGEWMARAFSPEDFAPSDPAPASYASVIVANSELPTIDGTPLSEKSTSPQMAIDSAIFPDLTSEGGLLTHCNNMIKLVVDDLIGARSSALREFFVRNLDDEILSVLTEMIQKIDGDRQLVSNEAVVLMDLVHKLISGDLFPYQRRREISEKLLGVHLHKDKQLFVPPLAGSILAQYLIQQQEDAKRSDVDSEAAVSFLNSLVAYHSKPLDEASPVVGVEKFQLAVFLFHTLSVNGKQAFLIKVADALTNLDERDSLPLATSRLLLLIDYVLHEFSAPADQLLHQVRYNFHSACALLSVGLPSDPLTTRERYNEIRLSLPFKDVQKKREEQKPKEKKEVASLIFPIQISRPALAEASEKLGDEMTSMFELSPNAGNAFEEEKRAVDSQAFDILLKNPEWYSAFYASCVSSLEAGSLVKREKGSAKAVEKVTRCNFQLAWRLLNALPQSEAFENKNKTTGPKTPSEYLVTLHHLVQRLQGNLAIVTPTEPSAPSPPENPPPDAFQFDDLLRQIVLLCEKCLSEFYVGSRQGAGSTTPPNDFELLVLDCMFSQTQAQLWAKFVKSMHKDDPYDALPMIGDLLTLVVKAVTKHAAICRQHVLGSALDDDPTRSCGDSNRESLDVLLRWIEVDTISISKESNNVPLPIAVAHVLAQWSALRTVTKEFENTDEENVNNSIRAHFKALVSLGDDADPGKALTLNLCLLETPLHRLCDDLVIWVRENSTELAQEVADVIIPLLSDVTFMDAQEQLKQSLEKITGGSPGSDAHDDTLNFYALKGVYTILTEHIDPKTGLTNKSVANKYISFLHDSLNVPSMHRAMNKFFVPTDYAASQGADKSVSVEESADLKKASFKGKCSSDRGSIVKLLLSNRMLATSEYSNKLLQFIAKLCKLANGNDPVAQLSLAPVCGQLRFFNLPLPEMREWISNFDLDAESSEGASLREEISSALLTLSQFVVSAQGNVQQLALCLLDAILPVEISPDFASSSLQAISPTFVVILATLANAQNGAGHHKLLAYALWWLDTCANVLKQSDKAKLMHSKTENEVTRAVTTCSSLMIYVSNVLTALQPAESSDPTEEVDTDLEDVLEASYDADCDFDEQEGDAGNEEDHCQDEEGLWNKLCTYTITQKKFMNQHWYHCHTCDMVEGVGVCTVCAKVCHKGHDLTYAKFGSFFCDCGAKEDKSCKALVKRVPGSDKIASGVSAFSDASRPASSSTSASNLAPPSASVSATSQKSVDTQKNARAAEAAANSVAQKLQSIGSLGIGGKKPKLICSKPLVVDASREKILRYLVDPKLPSDDRSPDVVPKVDGVVPVLLRVLEVMRSVVNTEEYKLNSTSSTLRALKAIDDLHKLSKPLSVVDTLMVPTLGSQEGAFENVKANFTGDQGQTIRQLINSRFIRRVAMCCLATTSGRRQHLAVSHEKTKVTLLQLSALLKQANVSKRKLTLTRLSTTAMPFSVTTITANPANEEVLAVCGLKDCHVLAFSSGPSSITSSGSVTQHLVLHPQLATNNYIIRAVWLPASPTILALVTADFIKIYDLAKDVLSPSYYLLLPTGKIRDATFVGGMQSDMETSIVVMSSTGYIYTQALNDESLALHGTFYLTNVLSVVHPHLKEGGGQVAGVSVYYSHSLKLLFFSFTNGRNFAGTMDSKMESVTKLFPIQYKGSNGGSGRNGSTNTLYEWSEVVNHPGLVFSFSQSQGCPVALVIEPDKMSLQEIKGVSAKAKIQDLVAVRHSGSAVVSGDTGDRTTVIVLCEDGSLRIYLASSDCTEYWLQPTLQATAVLGANRSGKKRAVQPTSQAKDGDSEDVSFPVDFFEGCQLISNNDLEFGGDPLEVYNAAQIKNRLNSTGMYIMEKNEFTLTITNKNPNMVITGVRMMVGSKGSLTAPVSVTVGQRFVSLGARITKARWFEFPLTRAESIAYCSKLNLTCGCSEHPDHNNIVDSIKVYGKTKESFGWPQEESTAAGKNGSSTQSSSDGKAASGKAVQATNGSDADSDISGESQVQSHSSVVNAGIADEFLLSCMAALHASFAERVETELGSDAHNRKMALEATSNLLTESLSPLVSANLKYLMKKLFANKEDCYTFMDEVLLRHVSNALKNEDCPESAERIDEDSFQRCLQILSVIARRRPVNITSFRQGKDDVKVIDLEAGGQAETPKKEGSFHDALLKRIMSAFWRLLSNKPRSKLLVPPCLPGLTRVEMTVKVIVDIVHAIAGSVKSSMESAVLTYFQLLTHGNPRVRFAAKSLLVRLMRPHVAETSGGGGGGGGGGQVALRSNSKSSETPLSSRSASPPSVASSQATTRAGAAPPDRNIHMVTSPLRDRPGSHISSLGTAGGTIDDDEEEEDVDDDDEEEEEEDDHEEDDDDEDDDDDDDDGHENYQSIHDSMDIDDMEHGQIEIGEAVLNEDHEYFQQVPEDHGPDFEQLLMVGHSEDGQEEEEEEQEQRDADADRSSSRVFAVDMMRAMAAEAENAAENLDDEGGHDLENMLMGIDFPQLLPPDVDDDEAMVEYAIALSLQQQQQNAASSQDRSPPPAQDAASEEQRNRIQSLSDGGSSSASDAGDAAPRSIPETEEALEDTPSRPEDSGATRACLEEERVLPEAACRVQDHIGSERLSEMRISLLEGLFSRLDEVEELGGEHSIPFFQVLAALISSLDLNNEQHAALHRRIVVSLVERLNRGIDSEDEESDMSMCTPAHEVFVIIMRLLSVMMLRSHVSSRPRGDVSAGASQSLHNATMRILGELKIVETCYKLLRKLHGEQWQKQGIDTTNKMAEVAPPASLLKTSTNVHVADMSPFFLRQYVQSHAGAIFEPYLPLITEMALHLTYQVRKHAPRGQDVGEMFDTRWRQLLSEFMLFPGVVSLVRRRARKLLLYITGSKEKYRTERDSYALEFYISTALELIGWQDGVPAVDDAPAQALNLSYNDLITLVETLRKCCEIAQSRVHNWQRYCVSNSSCLKFLLDTSIRAEENVAALTLKLLLCAISRESASHSKEKKLAKAASKGSLASAKSSATKVSAASSSAQSGGDKVLSQQLAQQVVDAISDSRLFEFFRHFLLEMNSSAIRWSAHDFVLNLFKNTKPDSQLRLVNITWQLCPQSSSYGEKASQFIDLLGYISMNVQLSQDTARSFTDATLQVLQKQNRLLSNHPNAILYTQLANYVQFDGFYLESNPCLVCNQLEAPLSNIKLTSIKSDMRYTTTQQIIKLVGSYAIQKVTIKLTDIKRTKMIRTAALYYNNKRVPAIVDLKNNPSMWHEAKKITVPQGEPEIRFDLPLPVVATNLMLEFTDFYENVSASIETLQCPRCSASVQANPGICSNCGENVFQCHKCRSINYDEKDPYLCNVCGFSKYAKFDVTVTAKQCCAVDSIENDDDRKKMVGNVVGLLEKADTVYNQLNAHKPQLEALLLQIAHISSDAPVQSSEPAALTRKGAVKGPHPNILGGQSPFGAGGNAPVSSSIQQLAKKYCQECKTQFEELTNLMRTVLASRSEIVDYDRRQRSAISGNGLDPAHRHVSTSWSWSQSAPDCYGCASASAQQCVTLLRVLATNEHAKPLLVESGLIQELVMYSLRRGTAKSRKQVHSLINQLITDNEEASQQLNQLLVSRITGAINHHRDELPPSAVACEMQLLTSVVNVKDRFWQLRLRAVMQLFQMSAKNKSPAVVENVTLPCVHMLRKLVSPGGKDTATSSGQDNLSVEAKEWMNGASGQSYEAWSKRKAKATTSRVPCDQKDKKAVRRRFLEEKFFAKWRRHVLGKKKQAPKKVQFSRHPFLRTMLFCPTSRAIRQAACAVITSLANNTSRKPLVLDLLTSYLDELGNAGESAAEFLKLYQDQIRPKQWRVYLASRGILPLLGSLIQQEIAKLSILEEKTLNLHLQQGYALKELTELLSEMVQVSHVRQHYKGKLVGTVLNSYLSLRRLVIQRTNLVDDAQDLLLELLEELTTGTESETRAFMAVCIEAIKKQDLSDLKTPQFIFERLANIIYPEENDTSEFFLSLDKDPLQEDFLQGRMVGNPYSSNEAGLGPLMRDVKNKICRDCDLIALLEDDSGMELLINNKIIALDLPVRDVYKKIWLPNHTEDDAMHVVYRMRGLLGEATEDIVKRLDSDKTDQDEEEVYKLASVLSECGGIEVMLARLESVRSLLHGRQLVEVVLKLLSHATKLKVNRQYLARPDLNSLNILLGSLNLGLQAGEDGVAMVEHLLKIMAIILQEAAADKTNQDADAEYLTGDKEKLTLLLQQIDSEFVQGHMRILQGILRIIPFLSFGDPDLMQLLVDHFISTLDFEQYDESHSDDETIYLNCFCDIVAGIHANASGWKLKDLMVKNNIVQNAVAYVTKLVPDDKMLDSDELRAVTSKPSLPFCLRILTGLCTKHVTSQELVGEKAVKALHRLEQISSEERIGPHAENVLEALQEHPEVAKEIKAARRQTREEKKKKAMEIRKKQLGALGMKTNDKGQMITKSTILQQISDLVEETGLTCIICREGYKFEPKKVLGIYTYTRRCPLEDFEAKARKTQGYSTVSHFNVVHYECHTAAVRTARGREEWDSALLQNTNTKCNGLLPLWGAQVPEAAFASCLARHNTYIQEATGQREPGFHSTVHDLKLLLLRFAYERSFSEETGGGGRQSNINLIPYMIHTGLYVINSTRGQSREERSIADFLSASQEKWVESSYEVDGPLYFAAMTPFLYGAAKWKEVRLAFLKRLLVLAQARKSSPNSASKLSERGVKEYATYKPYLLFWSLVDLIIRVLFKNVPEGGNCVQLASYIRHNDTQLIDAGEKMLANFQGDILVCESIDEFFDVTGLLVDIGGDVTAYAKALFDGLPT